MNRMSSLIFALICFGKSISVACSCFGNENIAEKIKASDMTFAGRLVKVSADSIPGSNSDPPTKTMKFHAKKISRKGKKEKSKWIFIRTASNSAACGFDMEVGQNAIIFAQANGGKSDTLYSNLCAGNIWNPTKQQVDSIWNYEKWN